MMERMFDSGRVPPRESPVAALGTSSVSAHDVARELRRRSPGLGVKKLHKLLYYAQGHHLAATGAPLFVESVSAWDMGPVVGQLWRREKDGEPPPPEALLDEAGLNTVGYVTSRYGSLSGLDLEHLTHSEDPWRLADQRRRPGESVRMELSTMRQYFAAASASVDDGDELHLDSGAVSEWLSGATTRRDEAVRADEPESLRRLLHGA